MTTQITRRVLQVLVVVVLGLAARDVIVLAFAQTQALPPPTTPTGRICVLCDFGKTPGDPVLRPAQGVTAGISLLAEGPDAELYGTSPFGGSAKSGTVFRVTRAGQMSVLHHFDGVAGGQPESGLTVGRAADGVTPDGNLYGTTIYGGIVNGVQKLAGTIFRIRPASGSTPQSASMLYNFRNGSTAGMELRACPTPPAKGPCVADAQEQLDAMASYPTSAPVAPGDGYLYGIAPFTNTFLGVLYRIPTSGGDRNYKALCAYGTLPIRKSMPTAQIQTMCMLNGVSRTWPTSLIVGVDKVTGTKVLYGTLVTGTGANAHGIVFQATLAGRVSEIHKFNGGDGAAPLSLMQATDGNLYGTTFKGGAQSSGVVFSLTRSGATWSPKVLVHFGTATEYGMQPFAGLVEGRDGLLYGATKSGISPNHAGIVFSVGMNGAGFKVLHTFPNDPRAGMMTFPTGKFPMASLLAHSDGSFYGTTTDGGAANVGVLYQLSGVNLPMTNAPSPFYTIVPGKLVSQPDQFVEVRTHEAMGQALPVCDPKAAYRHSPTGACVLRGISDDKIRIDVKNCRNPRIVQFLNRRETLLTKLEPEKDLLGGAGKCLYGSQSHAPYPPNTWRTDADCGKPNAYLDQNPGSARIYGPYTNPGGAPVDGMLAMSVWDQPWVADRADRATRVDFKDYVFCNCSAVRLVKWSRAQNGTAAPTYTGISISTPTEADIKWMTDQLVTDKFDPIPTLRLSTSGAIK